MTDASQSPTIARITRRTMLKGAAVGAAGVAASSVFAAPAFLRHASAQGTTTVRASFAPSSDVERQLVEQIFKNAEAKFPNIKISSEPIPQNYFDKLQTNIAAGTAADIFYLDSLPASDLMATGVLLPIDDYMAKDGVKKEDFYPGLIAAYEWQGKTYGLPKDWSSLAMVYDPKTFQDAGIAAAPTNWDELKAAAQKLKDKGGQAGIVYNASLDRFIAFLYQAGGSILSPDKKQVTIDSPQTKQALDFYYGMYKDGLVQTSADAGAQWAGDAFAKGLAGLVFEGNWMFPFLKQNAPDKKFAVAELPAGPAGKATMGFTVSWSIFGKTKVADAAWQVVNYLTGPEGMKAWTDLGLAMPARPALADAWSQKFPERAAFLSQGPNAHPWQVGPGGQKFNDDANAVLQAVFAGQTDTQKAVTQMADKAKADIKLAQ